MVRIQNFFDKMSFEVTLSLRDCLVIYRPPRPPRLRNMQQIRIQQTLSQSLHQSQQFH